MAYDGTLRFDTKLDTSGFQKGTSSLTSIVKGLGVFELLKKGMSMVVNSIDDAVARYDTLNKFPKIMEQMGYGAESGEAAIKKLSDGIQGLPTTLDEIVSNTQQLTIATGDLDKGTASALALNNAFLASGASTYQASRGMTQYLQMLTSGKVDMQSWNTLQETMPYALQKTAEAFGFTGESARNDLYAALRDGEITMMNFNDKIIELNEGVGGFAEVAKTATGGIGTAMTNFKTRVVMGVTSIIQAIDKGLSKTRFQSIENIINTSSTAMKSALEGVAKIAGFLAENIVAVIPIVAALAGVFVTMKVVSAIKASMDAFTKTLGNAKALLELATTATSRKMIVDVGATAAEKGLAVAMAAGNVIKAAAAVSTALLTGGEGAATVATVTLSGAMTALGAAIYAALGPIGVILLAIVAVIAAVALIVNAVQKANKAYYDEKEALKKLSEEHEEYANSLQESKRAASEEAQEKVVQAQHNRDLLNSLAALVDENGKFAGSSEEAQYAVSELSENIEGLGLTFDETTGQINMSSEELKKYGENLEATAKYKAAQEEYNKILSERNTIQAKINALEEKKELYNKMVEDGSITQRQANKLIKEADKLLGEYGDTMGELELDVQAYEAAVKNAYNSEAQIAIKRQKIVNNEKAELDSLAAKYGVSADKILNEASRMEGGLTEWSEKAAKLYTDEGVHINDLALQWGTTVAAIEDELANSNISLEEWETQQETLFAEWQAAAKGGMEDIINGFKEIPAAADMSLEELNSLLETNNARHATWKTNLVTASETLGPEMVSVIKSWGPGYNSLLEEYLADPKGEKGQMFYDQLKKAMETGTMGIEEATPGYGEAAKTAGTVVGDEFGTSLSENTAPDEAAQQIADNVVANLSDADYSGITEGIATSIESGTGNVTSAITNLTTGVKSAVAKMSTTASTDTGKMMSKIVSEITTKGASARTAAATAANGIVKAFSVLETDLREVGSSAITALVSELAKGAARAADAATNIGTRTKAALSAALNTYSIGTNAIDGMIKGLKDRASELYATADTIATNVSNTIKRALDERSPSRVMAGIFDLAVVGMINGLKGRATALYSQAGTLAQGVIGRLQNVPDDLATSFDAKLRAASLANSSAVITATPAVAVATSGSGGNTYIDQSKQTVNTKRYYTAAELTRAHSDQQRRNQWKLQTPTRYE